MAAIDHVRLADKLIDAAGAERLRAEAAVPGREVVALQIAERPAFTCDNELIHRRMRKADLKGRLEISQQQIAKQQRALEKKLRRKGLPEPAAPSATPEEFANRPEPKVVDTTALPTELPPPRKKPSLAELKRAEKSAAPPALTTAQEWDAENYELPGVDLLEEHGSEGRVAADPAELEEIQRKESRKKRKG